MRSEPTDRFQEFCLTGKEERRKSLGIQIFNFQEKARKPEIERERGPGALAKGLGSRDAPTIDSVDT